MKRIINIFNKFHLIILIVVTIMLYGSFTIYAYYKANFDIVVEQPNANLDKQSSTSSKNEIHKVDYQAKRKERENKYFSEAVTYPIAPIVETTSLDEETEEVATNENTEVQQTDNQVVEKSKEEKVVVEDKQNTTTNTTDKTDSTNKIEETTKPQTPDSEKPEDEKTEQPSSSLDTPTTPTIPDQNQPQNP